MSVRVRRRSVRSLMTSLGHNPDDEQRDAGEQAELSSDPRIIAITGPVIPEPSARRWRTPLRPQYTANGPIGRIEQSRPIVAAEIDIVAKPR